MKHELNESLRREEFLVIKGVGKIYDPDIITREGNEATGKPTQVFRCGSVGS
jgi:hypothetical protein